MTVGRTPCSRRRGASASAATAADRAEPPGAGSERRPASRFRRRGEAGGCGRWPLSRLVAVVAVAAGLAATLPTGPVSAKNPVGREGRVDAYLDQIRDEPGRLSEFLGELPKGGDLHTHLSGAVPTERLIDLAADDGLCIDTSGYTASPGPCRGNRRPATAARTDDRFHDQVVRAWSMKGFAGEREDDGHDHFFDAFPKFKAATTRKGDMLAVVAKQAASQHIDYLEPLYGRQRDAIAELAERVGFDKDLSVTRGRLLATESFNEIVETALRETDQDFTRARTLLRCGTAGADPGCGVTIRTGFQVGRKAKPAVVFANLLLGFVLAERDPRYVGVNLVQAEDAPRALKDYRLHMRMVKNLRRVYRKARISLHAGGLASGFGAARTADLRFHIRDAVETGGADRIGHGVAIGSEDRPADLIDDLARRHIPIEVPLTSDCQVLRVCGAEHPFARYRRHDVPVVLATDGGGVTQTDLTDEFTRAVRDFDLPYPDLKTLARASLEHAFLSGRSLWRGAGDHRPADECAGDELGEPVPSTPCRALLRSSDKATLQWRHEAAVQRFERRYGGDEGGEPDDAASPAG